MCHELADSYHQGSKGTVACTVSHSQKEELPQCSSAIGTGHSRPQGPTCNVCQPLTAHRGLLAQICPTKSHRGGLSVLSRHTWLLLSRGYHQSCLQDMPWASMATLTFLYLKSPTVNVQAVASALCPRSFCRRNCIPTPPVRTPRTTLETLTIHMTVKRTGSLSSLLDARQDGGAAGLQRAEPGPA